MDLEELSRELEAKLGRGPERHEVVTAALYPRVYADYLDFRRRHGDVALLDTPNYFYGLEPSEEIWVELEPGKILVISLEAVGEPNEDGACTVYFQLNGQNRQVTVVDRSRAGAATARRTADPGRAGEVGAPMPGTVIAVHCEEGGRVAEGEPLLTLEAMKMETVVRAPLSGMVTEIAVDVKATVATGDLLVVLQGGQ